MHNQQRASIAYNYLSIHVVAIVPYNTEKLWWMKHTYSLDEQNFDETENHMLNIYLC